MIRALLFYEADGGYIPFEVGELMTAVAADLAARHGFAVASQEQTRSDDGERAILVWNLEEVK